MNSHLVFGTVVVDGTLENEQARPVDSPFASGAPVHSQMEVDRASFGSMAAHAQKLRAGVHARELRRGFGADPTVVIARKAFQFVPAAQEAAFMTRD